MRSEHPIKCSNGEISAATHFVGAAAAGTQALGAGEK